MTSPTYRIPQWDDCFESSESRKRKELKWVRFPNKHDGEGLREILQLKDGVEILGAWMLMVQVASKCPVRGTLHSGHHPFDARKLSLKTGAPAKCFERAFTVLTDVEIGWLERDTPLPGHENGDSEGDSSALPLSADGLADDADGLAASAARHPLDKNRIDKKREEENRQDQAKQIYDAYPRKKARKEAIKAILKLLKTMDFEDLMAKTQAYRDGPDVRKLKEDGRADVIPYPATWFNGARWEDESDSKAAHRPRVESEGPNTPSPFALACERYEAYHAQQLKAAEDNGATPDELREMYRASRAGVVNVQPDWQPPEHGGNADE